MAPIDYEKRRFDVLPTYTDKEFLNAIFKATGLQERKTTALVVDLMSGPGKVALGMQEKDSRHSYAVLDYNRGQLDRINQPHLWKILGDVTNLPATVEDGSVGVATVRYGLKDIPEGQQAGVLQGIHRALEKEGTLVLVDMISPEGAKEFTNKQHSLKQQLGGRDIGKEGECHIPTEQEWLDMLKATGFDPKVVGYYTSHVSTAQWLTDRQFGDPESAEAARKKVQMDTIILGASDEIKKQFNIREENGEVKIDYPVVIIRAVKKDIQPDLPFTGDVYVER